MLQLRDISYAAGGKEILKHIDLDIHERFVAITGPNGSGKSTLAKLIMGIEHPQHGVSFAFQQPVRFKGITVRDLISLAAGKRLSVAQACEYLSQVGLCAKDYITREVNASLSGGELKRIEIAMINARGTKLSIFDEPEAGIDLWSFQSLIKVFEDMYARTRGSILIISHQERILNIADKIVVLADGKIAAVGTKDEILPTLLGVRKECRVSAQTGKESHLSEPDVVCGATQDARDKTEDRPVVKPIDPSPSLQKGCV